MKKIIKIKETENYCFNKELTFKLQNESGRYSSFKLNDYIEKRFKNNSGYLFRASGFVSDIIIPYELDKTIEDIDYKVFLEELDQEITRLFYIFSPTVHLSKESKEVFNKINMLITKK